MIQKLTRDQCIKKFKGIGQHDPGTLGKMKMRLRKFSLYPKLYRRLKLKAQREYSFILQLMKTFLMHIAPLNIREIEDNRKKPYVAKQKNHF